MMTPILRTTIAIGARGLRTLAFLAVLLPLSSAAGVEIEGFTQPYRTVNVASPEQGIVSEVAVQVGDNVKQGQVIAKLDDELHTIMMETARQRKHARGRLEAAEAELRMRNFRLEKLRELKSNGFGRREEVERAAADLEVAQAELKASREDVIDKQWQFQKIEAEWRRRVITSPMDGVVVERLKEAGEYVAPNEPNIVTIAQVDPLLAKFSVKRSLARHIHVDDEVRVRFEEIGKIVLGKVEVVSPVVDAQSGTIKIKVRIDNPHRLILSGERCLIHIAVDGTPTISTQEESTNHMASHH